MKAAVLAVFVTLAASSAALLLGSNRCTWGPSYWCAELGHAKECSAMDHCVNVFWKNMQPATSVRNPDVCQLCENIVTDLRQFILNGKPQQQIESCLDNFCNILPDDYSRTTCDNVVQHYLGEAFQIINSTLEPQTVCQIFGLCQAASVKQDLSEKPAGAVEPAAAGRATEQVLRKVMLQKAPQPSALKTLLKPAAPQAVYQPAMVQANPADCLACKLFAEKILDSLSTNATEQEIAVYIEKNLCSRLGTLAQQCDQAVEQYLPQLVQLILSKATPDVVCSALGLCGALTTVAGRTVPRNTLLAEMKLASAGFRSLAAQQPNDKCDTCEEVINYVKLALSDNGTEEYILNFISGEVCPLFGPLNAECVDLIKQYGNEIFTLLLNELDPAKICNLLGFCPSPAGSVRSVSAAARPDAVTGTAECILCEFLVDKLDGLISGNRTEAAIENALGKVCSVLPRTVRDECNALVSNYAPEIINALLSAASSKVVCSYIGVCAVGSTHHKANQLATGDSVQCDVCVEVATFAEAQLQANATQAAIISGLEKLCSELPSLVAAECSALVSEYLSSILKLLLAKEDPQKICQAIGLCQPPMKTAKILPLH